MSKRPENVRCENCCYFEPDQFIAGNLPGADGYCARRPPGTCVTIEAKQGGILNTWRAITTKAAFCGEFRETWPGAKPFVVPDCICNAPIPGAPILCPVHGRENWKGRHGMTFMPPEVDPSVADAVKGKKYPKAPSCEFFDGTPMPPCGHYPDRKGRCRDASDRVVKGCSQKGADTCT